MQHWIRATALVAVASMISACSDNNAVVEAIEEVLDVRVQVVHASPDAPAVNVNVDGDEILPGVAFKEGSPFIALPSGTYDITVDAILPGDTVTEVIDLTGTALDADTDYTVIATGFTADLLNAGPRPLQPLIIANPSSAVGAGNVRAQVVHGAPSAPEVTVFVTGVGADLQQATPLGSFEFGGDLGPAEIPAGEYQIRVTLPFTPPAEPTVVFDSGPVPLPEGADLIVVAVDNTTTGDAPITLLVLDGENAPGELLSAGTPADVRVVHAAPDAGPVDVLVDDAPVVTDLQFPNFTGFLDPSPAPGTYNVKVVDNATKTFEALNIDPSFEAGVAYTVVAAGFVNDIQADSLILEDDNRSVVTEAKVRVLHASPSTDGVDIYVTDGPSDVELTTVDPALPGVAYWEVRGYVGLAEGSYDIRVTPAGDDGTIAIDVQDFPFVAGCVYTLIARDAENSVGPLGVIVIDECAD